jgi:hypothetical protein
MSARAAGRCCARRRGTAASSARSARCGARRSRRSGPAGPAADADPWRSRSFATPSRSAAASSPPTAQTDQPTQEGSAHPRSLSATTCTAAVFGQHQVGRPVRGIRCAYVNRCPQLGPRGVRDANAHPAPPRRPGLASDVGRCRRRTRPRRRLLHETGDLPRRRARCACRQIGSGEPVLPAKADKASGSNTIHRAVRGPAPFTQRAALLADVRAHSGDFDSGTASKPCRLGSGAAVRMPQSHCSRSASHRVEQVYTRITAARLIEAEAVPSQAGAGKVKPIPSPGVVGGTAAHWRLASVRLEVLPR